MMSAPFADEGLNECGTVDATRPTLCRMLSHDSNTSEQPLPHGRGSETFWGGDLHFDEDQIVDRNLLHGNQPTGDVMPSGGCRHSWPVSHGV